MALYTFILEFAGGTYMSQVEAPTPDTACAEWAKNLEISEIDGLDLKGQNTLIEEVKKELPVPLNGLINSWFVSALIQGKSALINLIQTERNGTP